MPRMRRQHSFVARGRSRRLSRRLIAGSLRPGLACLVLVVFLSPALASAAREPGPGPNALLEAFPLNPTGERIVSPTYARPGTFRPPVQPAAVARSRGTDLVLLAAIGGGSVVALLALVGLATVLLRSPVRPKRGHRRPGETVGLHQCGLHGNEALAGDRGSLSPKAGSRPDEGSRTLLVGCAVAVVVALLVFQYVG